MRHIVIAAVAALAASSGALGQGIGGSYAVEGTNINGTTYSGSAEIVVTSETTCAIAWTTGGTTSEGVCMRNGNAFSAAYMLGDAVGLLIYEVMDDGTLDGIWTIAGVDGVGYETLTPQ